MASDREPADVETLPHKQCFHRMFGGERASSAVSSEAQYFSGQAQASGATQCRHPSRPPRCQWRRRADGRLGGHAAGSRALRERPLCDAFGRQADLRGRSARRRRHDHAARSPLAYRLRSLASACSTYLRDGVHVLHAHKFGSNVWGTLLGRLARVPVVIAHEQSWASARSSTAGPFVRSTIDREVIARGADVFIAVSEADKRRMIEVEGIPSSAPAGHPERGRRLPCPQAMTSGPSSGSLRDAPVVVTVCQLRPEKAVEVLVEAAALLRDRQPGASRPRRRRRGRARAPGVAHRGAGPCRLRPPAGDPT